ncbi:hypothetical protein FRC20_010821 [Serendipita sp. 405]|nr:hypothetical protein FRC20_010821 [Serendipita sp. 405]
MYPIFRPERLDPAMSSTVSTPSDSVNVTDLNQSSQSSSSLFTFEEVVQQEYKHLSKVHPKPKDTPSCMQLFQLVMGCNGIKNHVTNLYREGQMANCSEKWEDTKFCMSMRTKSPEERREAWLMRRAEWWAKRRTSGSSEDVWDIRTESLPNYPPPPTRFIYNQEKKEFVIIPSPTTGSQ